jgi:hypothetical protein
VIQPVLPLYECAAESVATERLHSVADPAVGGVALTKTSCLYAQV